MTSPKQAIDDVLQITKEHITQFRKAHILYVYGYGFFCDALNRDAFLVANSEEFHKRAFATYKGSFGEANEDYFRWEIGNWEFPAGLFPSSSLEYMTIEKEWKKVIGNMSQMELEDLCIDTLLRIYELPNSPLGNISGIIVSGPDDTPDDILRKRVLLGSSESSVLSP